MDPRLTLAILTGKATKNLIKLKKGGATAAPGLFSLYLDKNAFQKLSQALERTILVSGTNGKTTSARLIGSFLESQQISYIHNRHGSNLERGLLSALLDSSSPNGGLSRKNALFEVDEAVLGNVLPKLKPTVITLTNLFRDQLDRYGEIDNIKRLWQKSLKNLDQSTRLVLNADDPSLAFLGKESGVEPLFFGIEDPTVQLEDTPAVLDSSKCPICHEELHYSHYYSSHQGDYQCKNCSFKRPPLAIAAKNIEFSESGTTRFEIVDGEVSLEINSRLSGLYNIYNILASYSSVRALSFDVQTFPQVVAEFSSVFGRGERLETQGKEILVTLAKNPTGFNEIIRTFLKKEKQNLLIIINDRIADGRDVSWLWDVDFEALQNKNLNLTVSGIRATDMGLRLKYAGISDFETEPNISAAFEKSLEPIDSGETLTIIPTYTGMLELREILAKKKISGQFWED